MITPKDFRFFLDSGAYSAWTRGVKLDLDEYCEFIRANLDLIDVYASLDVIPGAPGRVATQAERDAAAEESWANYVRMRSLGFDPIPVYHYGEHQRFLERMLAEKTPYIGIGGLVGVSGVSRRLWLDPVFDKITDDFGSPLVKTHGFGMTSIPLIFRYPWHSIDSTSWIRTTANGSVYLPALRGGQFVFDAVPQIVIVSSDNLNKSTEKRHYKFMSPAMRAITDRWLEFCSKTYDDVSSHYSHRAACNAMFFKLVGEAKTTDQFLHKKSLRARSLL
jgi:hypothetical protein